MKLVDTHNHLTGWSPDAEQTFGQLTASACERGLLGFAVSDHFDLDVTAEFEENPWVVTSPLTDTFMNDAACLPGEKKAILPISPFAGARVDASEWKTAAGNQRVVSF